MLSVFLQPASYDLIVSELSVTITYPLTIRGTLSSRANAQALRQ